MSLVVAGIVGAVGLGISAYGAVTQAGIAGKAESLAGAQWTDQSWYDQQLVNLIQNPSGWTNSATFQSGLNQGLSGVQRSVIAGGGGGGGEAAALEQYGQSQSLNSLFQQEQLLGSLSGLSANPATALNTASGANATGASMLSGGLNAASFAALLGMSGGAGGFSTSDLAMLAGGGGSGSGSPLLPGTGGYVYNNPTAGPNG